MKKQMKSLAVLSCSLLLLAGCGGDKKESGDVINIWCWNNEFQSRFIIKN